MAGWSKTSWAVPETRQRGRLRPQPGHEGRRGKARPQGEHIDQVSQPAQIERAKQVVGHPGPQQLERLLGPVPVAEHDRRQRALCLRERPDQAGHLIDFTDAVLVREHQHHIVLSDSVMGLGGPGGDNQIEVVDRINHPLHGLDQRGIPTDQ